MRRTCTRQLSQIAAIQPHTPDWLAQSRCQMRAIQRVVGIDQENGGFTQQFLQRAEAALFIAKRHGPGMRRGSKHRNVKTHARFRIAGARAAAHKSGATRQNAGAGEWARRLPNSTMGRPSAANTQRAAFDATIVWNMKVESRYVSTNCASTKGARTMAIGSLANTGVPSGNANRSPVKRSFARKSKNSGGVCLNCAERAKIIDLFRLETCSSRKYSTACAKPAAIKKLRGFRQAPDGEFEGRDFVGLTFGEIPRRHGEFDRDRY